ncbi:tRNA (guanosine(46)-N7)-methyltransferase TrmB [Collinsella provencensis]|uniref:tRNA (guanosine(46)-N7)-methyltransferase TrmB n=1 Tax=Collinsella provencensis TaxID=1937461 RepID=UPI001F30CFE3|nr:tRNA (guanosine(46)-N7)-methyltransferase TrmB [Collinsella provencensis]
MPKNFVLDQRIERAADAIETNAAAYRGRWAEACFPLCAEGVSRFERVHLDLGCGKGAYIAAMAKRHPTTLFIGMDSEPVCVVHAAQLVLDEDIKNALVIPGDAAKLDQIFAEGELDAISINFPTPHPKRRHARLRLTSAQHLEGYRPLLAGSATVALRTDSEPLYKYSLPQFEALGWNILCATDDDRAAHPEQPITEYEERLTAQGATVHAIYATPPSTPATTEQLQAAEDMPLSLIDYLPEDLFASDYIPYGMSYAVDNLRNRRRNESRKKRV